MDRAPKDMPLLAHIAELRKLVILSCISVFVAAVVAYVFYDYIIDVLYTPLEVLESGQADLLFITSITEGFMTRLKVAVLTGVVVSLPVHILNSIRFVFPGLETRERRMVLVALVVSGAFVVLSFLYSYYRVVPISIQFLTGSGFIPNRTGMLLSFSGNIFFILQFLFVALLIFQIPIVLEVLMAMNVVSRKMLWRSGRYVTVGIFTLAAVVTPPDIVTQLGIALPLVLLYFAAILIAKVFRFGGS